MKVVSAYPVSSRSPIRACRPLAASRLSASSPAACGQRPSMIRDQRSGSDGNTISSVSAVARPLRSVVVMLRLGSEASAPATPVKALATAARSASGPRVTTTSAVEIGSD